MGHPEKSAHGLYYENKTYTHVRIICDNITAIMYINNMGRVNI